MAGKACRDGVSARRKRGPFVKGVERDKWGHTIRTCGIADYQYMIGKTEHMKKHKAAKHGINVVWFPSGEDNCGYRAKLKGSLK